MWSTQRVGAQLFLIGMDNMVGILASIFLGRLLGTMGFLVSTGDVFVFFRGPILREITLVERVGSGVLT